MDLDPGAIERMFSELMGDEYLWTANDHGTFFDVTPVADVREHWLGDECWCKPVREFVPRGLPDLMFTHQALDGRE